MTHLSRLLVLAPLLASTLARPAAAQIVPIPGAEPQLTAAERAAYRVSRADLGRVYLALERAVANRPDRVEPHVREINQRVDSATGYFFSGDFPTACRILAEQTLAIAHDPLHITDTLREAAGVRARVVPPVLAGEAASRPELTIELARLYPQPAKPADPPTQFTLRLTTEDGTVHLQTRVPAPQGPDFQTAYRAKFDRPIGGRVSVEIGDGQSFLEIGTLILEDQTFHQARQHLIDRVNKVTADGGLAHAVWVARWRIEQLTDENAAGTAGLVQDLSSLWFRLVLEVEALEAGRDPYADFAGDRWLPASVSGTALPMRVFVPGTRALGGEESTSKLPIVIAVHGAGGDEHLFASGYGGGLLTRLAEDHRFILISPQASFFTGMPATFDAIVDAIRSHPRADTSRIYLIGHSLGGGIVTSWAKARPDAISGVVSIAGIGLFNGSKTLPRTLSIAGELDSLCPPARIERDAKAAAAAGLPVEYREIRDYGHVLVVGKCLPDAVDWLIGERVPPAGAPPQKIPVKP